MKKIFFALMLGLAAVACTTAEYDDTAIKEQLGELDGRLDKVEEELATLQLNVDAMKSLAQALKDGKYITSYVALEDNTGYTINFSDNTSIVIEKGEKGDKGESGNTGEPGQTGPAGKDAEKVTIAEKDGELYWFIGEVAQIPVYEAAPVFTSVDGKLYVQFGDKEPEEIGTLTGKSIFEDVKVEGNEMVFTFLPVGEEAEGLVYRVPLAEKFALVIDAEVGLAENATEAVLAYEVKGANANTVVDVLAHGCEAVVEAGVIKVSAIVEGATLLVFADNGEGKTSIKKVTFAPESFEVSDVDEVVSFKGGSVEVKGITNIAFEVVIPEDAQSWLSCAETKAAFSYTFTAAPNTVEETRSAEVSFVRFGTEEVLKTVTIEQAAYVPFAKLVKAFQSHGKDSYMTALGASDGKDRNIAINDEYLFIPETQGSPVMWKVSLADGSAVRMPVGTVATDGTFALACPRFLANTDETINGGKDVLVVSSMGMGGQETYLYFYNNGFEADPHKVALNVPGAGGRRLGDKMSLYGTMQNWGLYYKEQGSSAIVNYGGTYRVLGMDDIWAAGRCHMDPTSDASLGGIYFYDFATAGSKGVVSTVENCKYGIINSEVVFDGKSVYQAQPWGTDPKLAGCHGFNFFKHGEENYIAYTNFPAKKLIIIEGAASADGVQAALEAHKVVFEVSIAADDNACPSGNSAADCSVYQKDGVTYVAGHIQNVGVVVYKLN